MYFVDYLQDSNPVNNIIYFDGDIFLAFVLCFTNQEYHFKLIFTH